MKKVIKPCMLALALSTGLCACSNEENVEPAPNPDAPGVVSPDSPDISDPDQPVLPTVSSLTLTSSEGEMLGKYLDASFKMNSLFASDIAADGSNFNVSPLSAIMAVSLLANSVEAPASDAMVAMFDLNSLDALNALNYKLLTYLPSPELGAVVKLANGIWHHNQFETTAAYREFMGRSYGAAILAADFSDSQTGKAIDSWIERNTEGMIKDANVQVDPRMPITMVNTMYFAGVWGTKFDKNATKDATFHSNLGDVTVPMMNRTFETSYSRDANFEMVSLPFEGRWYELDIILPAEGLDAGTSAAKLTADTFNSLLKTASITEVEFSMPRIKSNERTEIKAILSKMGLPGGYLSLLPMGIESTCPIESILQITALEVDEDGTKAAAATITSASSAGPGETPKHVRVNVNRPFYYVLRSTRGNVVLMMGRVSEF